VRAREIKVESSNWPDYVFNQTYKLFPLSDLRTYIAKNKHLPEIQTELQVTSEGINLGEINKLLTKKVEELTLYLFEKHDQIEAQRKITSAQQLLLEKQGLAVQKLEERLKRIENSLEKPKSNFYSSDS